MTITDLAKEYKEFINTIAPIEWYQFSLISLNKIVGGKGIKGGRVIQLLGNKSSGKSSLALDLIANAQKNGKTCAYIDFECTYDSDYASFLGVNTDDLIVVNTDTAENGFMLCEKLVDSGVSLIVIDSIAAPVSKSELDKDLNDNDDVRAITITGAGKAFSAGQDLAEAVEKDGPSFETILLIISSDYYFFYLFCFYFKTPLFCYPT